MGEKKELKVKLSTVVFLFIIFILMIALGVTYYLGFVKDKNENKSTNIIQTNTIEKNKIEENTIKENTIEENTIKNGNKISKQSITGTYFIQADKSLLDEEYFETAYVKDENIEFKDDETFKAYTGWGMGISGTYKIENNTITCIANRFYSDNSPEQKINITISFKILNDYTIEIIDAPKTYKIKVVDLVNKTLTEEEKELSLQPFVKGIKLTKDTDIEYQELKDKLELNELFLLINIDKNTDGTYTLYGGIYQKNNLSSAEFSNSYKKVTVSGDTKYNDYNHGETTIKEFYENTNFSEITNYKNPGISLPLKVYANSYKLLYFEFSQSKCIKIEETPLAT